MQNRFTIQLAIALIAAILPWAANAAPEFTCPIDWYALLAVRDNPERLIYGVKAGNWTKEMVDQALAKNEECESKSPDADFLKKARNDDLRERAYPNVVHALEQRDSHIKQQEEMAKREAEEKVRQEQVHTQQAFEIEQERQQQIVTQEATQRKTNLIIVLISVGLIGAAILWNVFVRNRCPKCKSSSVDLVDVTETDRWRGTKKVSEKFKHGESVRHVQTTYVTKRYSYCCRACQTTWEKERKEEKGQSGFSAWIDRILSGY